MTRPFARRPVHPVCAALRSGMGLLGALLLAATSAFAADHLLYLEAQGVAGYDFRDREV